MPLNLVTLFLCQISVVLVILNLRNINVDKITRQIRQRNPTQIWAGRALQKSTGTVC
jgi:hypothetical protein